MNNIAIVFVLCGLLLPFLLWIGGIFNIAPGLRFKISIIALMIVWCVLNHFIFNWNYLCGLLCISAISLIAFMFWSVLCWGYTLSMVLCFKEDSVQTIEQWEIQYAGEPGLKTLSMDRLNVLLGLRFASLVKNEVILTKFGLISAKRIKILSRLFGVTS